MEKFLKILGPPLKLSTKCSTRMSIEKQTREDEGGVFCLFLFPSLVAYITVFSYGRQALGRCRPPARNARKTTDMSKKSKDRLRDPILLQRG